MNVIQSTSAHPTAARELGWPVITDEIDTAELLAEVLDVMARWSYGLLKYAEAQLAEINPSDHFNTDAKYWRGIKVCAEQVRDSIKSELETVTA